MAKRSDTQGRLDDAARAGWLYYVAGNTQDQIAAKLGVSRQTAQRLVSLAVSERLIKVRLDHPIAKCLDLSQRLIAKHGLQLCEVVPADPTSPSTTLGVAEAMAAELERRLQSQHPIVVAMGSGRTLRAAVEQLPPMECPQHKIVSLVGNIAPDEAANLLERRCETLTLQLTAARSVLALTREKQLPRLFVIDREYRIALHETELAWVRTLIAEIRSGQLEGSDRWRSWFAPTADET